MADSKQASTRPQMAHGVRDYLERERQRILASCTACGKCFEACPMPEYIGNRGSETPAEVTADVLQLLRTGTTGATALGWIGVCVRSGECVKACPENVNPKLMLRLAKMIATGGLGGEKLIKVKEDRDYFSRIRAFAQLQLSEQEIKEWME
jgi:ferredoxin